MLFYQILVPIIHGKRWKYKSMNLKYLPKGSYSISDIQDYLKYISKKHETVTSNRPIKKYVNKTEKRISTKIKYIYLNS